MIEAPPGPAPGAIPGKVRSAGSWGVPVALVSIGVAFVAGKWLQARGTRLFSRLPPLTGAWDPTVTWRVLPVLTVGILAVVAGPRLARDRSWRAVLLLAATAALAWSAALAFTEGVAGFVGPPAAPSDYLASIRFVAEPFAFLHGFVARIGIYSTHVRAHPPGLVLLVWAMDRVGLGGAGWVATVEHVAAASAVPAVLLATREVAGEQVARRAAPFLALLPAASAATSGDALFLGVSAWAVAALILATAGAGRRADVRAAVGGAAFGVGLLLSYGLVLVAAVPVAVAVSRRRVRPLVVAAISAVGVLVLARLAGFDWLAGLDATRREYAESIARFRPYAYFLFADLAALAVALGPAVWASLPRLRDRRTWLVVGAGLAAVVLADLSGLSKGEVERIWLPFMPWIAVATGAAFATEREGRSWLAAQVGWAIALEVAVRWPW